MSDDELGRIRGDLAVMQRAMGLRLSFDGGMLAFGILLTVASVVAAAVSLLVDDDRAQVVPFATIMVLGPVGLFLRSRRAPDLGPEIIAQVMLSISIYAVVWVAGWGYAMAVFAGPAVGPARTAGLYAASIGLLFAFSLILVRAALKSREHHYCLGLAISTLLAGMLLPILDPRYCLPVAHGLMALGYLTAVAIQWFQLREATANHAAD
ncbi:hypothetical protein EP7_002277 [Isosphaeraceae bacterium EP7]